MSISAHRIFILSIQTLLHTYPHLIHDAGQLLSTGNCRHTCTIMDFVASIDTLIEKFLAYQITVEACFDRTLGSWAN